MRRFPWFLVPVAFTGCESKTDRLDTVAPVLAGEARLDPLSLRAGVTATLTFDVSEPLARAPEVTVQAPGPRPLELDEARSSGERFTFTYTARSDEPEGADAPVNIVLADRSGNLSGDISGGILRFDFTPPSLAGPVRVAPAFARADTFVEVTFQVSEPLARDPIVTVGGLPLLGGAVGGEIYRYAYLVTAADSEGGKEISIALADLALNEAALPAVGSFEVDLTPPRATLVSLDAGPLRSPGGAEPDVVGQVRFELSEPADPARSDVVVQVGPLAAACPAGLATSFDCPFAVPRGLSSGDPLEGVGAVTVEARDQAGNLAWQNLGMVALDFTPPSLTLFASPNPARKGDAIVFSVTSNEALGAPPVISAPFVTGTPSCAGPVPGVSFSCGGANVSATAQTGTASFTADGPDRAGNSFANAVGTVTIEAPPPPVISSVGVAPDVAKEGDALAIVFTANQDLTSCAAAIGGQAASCAAPSGRGCSCAFTVGGAVPEGAVAVSVYASNASGTGNAAGAVQIDRTPPRVDGALLAMVHHPLATDEGVAASAGAVREANAVSYPGEKVCLVQVFSAESGGGPLVTAAPVVPAGDGSLAEVALPGTGSSAPARLWASAVDLPGNESERVEILGGKDDAPPAIDGARIVFYSRPQGTPDGVAGLAGAVTDALSAIAGVRVYAAAAGGAALWAPIVQAADGSFPEQAIGDTVISQPYLEAVDKAGNVSSRVRAGSYHATISLAGRAPYDDGVTAATLHPFAADDDPRTAGPGPAGTAAEAAAAVSQAAAAIDAARAALIARPETASLAAGWVLGLSARVGHAMAYDAGRGKVVLFGGYSGSGVYLADTWEYDVGGWKKMPTATAPSARFHHAMAYDAGRGKVVLFGGSTSSGSLVADTWEYDATGWKLMTTATAPSARFYHAMAYDAGRAKVVLFGGYSVVPVADTWEYDAAGWKQVTTATAPSARYWHAMAYDAGRGKVVLFAGYSGGPTEDTWEYDATGWTQMTTATAPSARYGHAMVHDVGRGKIVLFGGSSSAADTWEYDASGWNQITTATAPPARERHAMAYDAGRGKVVLFGGVSGGLVADTWEFDADGWKQTTSATVPSARSSPAMAYDAERGKVVLFGGYSGNFPQADTWEYDATGWKLMTTATTPSARSNHAMAYDAGRGKVVLFGGSNSGGAPLADTWEYDAGGWNQVTTATAPSARSGHAMAYDAGRGKVVLFGGDANGSLVANNTWEYDAGGWKRVTTATAPSARSIHAMAYDAGRGKVVLFGGFADSGVFLADTWEYDAAGWKQVTTATAPSVRRGPAMAYDAGRGKVILFGGYTGSVSLADTWEYDATGWKQITPATAPLARYIHAMAYDAGRGKVVLFGGFAGSGISLADTWEYSASTPHPRTAVHAFQFPLGSGASVTSLAATYVGAGRGDSAGAPAAGIDVYLWSWTASNWVTVGGNVAIDTDPAADRTVVGSPPAPVGDYVLDGRIWLMAVSRYPSSAPPGSIPSEIWTDYVELRASYTLP